MLTSVTVGVGARDGFTVRITRGGGELLAVRGPSGLDANVAVGIGRVAVTPGETLELWVGDADG